MNSEGSIVGERLLSKHSVRMTLNNVIWAVLATWRMDKYLHYVS